MTAGLQATRREWIGLGVLALPCMLYSMDLTVLNLAVPQLAADLNPTAIQLLWIIDIYGFMVAGFLMTMGTLGDRIGRRKLLLVGAAAFGAASILAAFSTSAEMLIITRAILGVAGATLAPSTLSLLTAMFRDPAERTFAISMWISSFSAGAIDVAKSLPADAAQPLLDAGRHAFNSGFQVAAIISAVGMLAAAIVTLTVLRNVQQAEGGAHP
jgi:MFS family permease